MSRLWPDGHPLEVVTDTEGLPRSFRWNGRRHIVAHIANRSRVDEGWWERRVWHDRFKVATDGGLLAVIFRDLCEGSWYMECELD
jgi:hypothetical protein